MEVISPWVVSGGGDPIEGSRAMSEVTAPASASPGRSWSLTRRIVVLASDGNELAELTFVGAVD